MIINEDYFDDLEIKDEDIAVDDNLDVDGPEHELTVEEVKKLPEQYNQVITFRIRVYDNSDITFIQTSLLPRITKRLDSIFDMYGIEHSLYILTSATVEYCKTVVEFGDYQLFCDKGDEDKFINITFDEDGEHLFINVYVNYPKFTYKRAFRFLYTMLNLYKNCKLINLMGFEPTTTNDYVIALTIWNSIYHILLFSFDKKWHHRGPQIYLDMELTEEDKREFYKSVFRHFFGEGVRVPYKLIDRDVPLKPL